MSDGLPARPDTSVALPGHRGAATPKRTGRPSKLTPQRQGKVCAALANGLPLESAAALAGISRSTLFDWRRRGAAGEQPYLNFLDATRAAEASAEQALVDVIREAAVEGKDWRAAATILGRRWPETWSENHRTAASGPDGNPVRLDLNGIVELAITKASRARTRIEGGPDGH